jgi:polyphosphate kinase
MVRRTLDNPAYYLNRESSWLDFDRRVLEEAEDERNPLLERVKFLAISASNLDEFFEVRVSGLLQRIEDGLTEADADGMAPAEQLNLVAEKAQELVQAQYRCWNQQLHPALTENGIRVLGMRELNAGARQFVAEYREKELDPLLTPVTVDPAHPFPRVLNKALCQALLLKRRRRSAMTYMGVVTVPRALPRLVRLPRTNGTDDYIFLADLVAAHASEMYRGYDIISEASFRITRNSNLYLQEEESRSLLESVRAELHNRRKGDAVRLEIEVDASNDIVDRLRNNFGLDPWQVFRTDGPVNLSRLMFLYSETDRPDLKYKPFAPRELQAGARSKDIFEKLRQRDILLHHPFDSYKPVVSFIASAATDPRVLSIKQTLYRTDEDSPIVQALMDAAAAGKEVTVVVELKARFDEAPNIRWARSLEDAGVQVFHGLVGPKTHCKLALLARKEADGVIRQYAHLGTGNYNPTTAKLYTDLSLLTSDSEITTAVHDLFNFLTAYSEYSNYDPLLVAPVDMANKTLALIAREARHAREGRPAHIIAKMNSLLDAGIIRELYRASQAGVQIDLIVRGMCGLRPGVRGVSSRIRVRSIVGRFLEHSRIFYFANGGDEEVWLGSGDWRARNLYARVEAQFPVKDAMLRQRIKEEILQAYLADTCKARLLKPDGTYVLLGKKAKSGFSSQDFLIQLAEGKQHPGAIPHKIEGKPKRSRRAATPAR